MDGSSGRLAQAAERRHGIFTSMDAEQAGVPDWSLRRLVATGWCERVAPGVYRVVGAARSGEQRLAAAVAAQSGAVAVSHQAAAAVWRLPTFDLRTPIVSVERGRSHRNALAVVRTTLWLPPEHVGSWHAIPVTTVARTLFDVAGVVAPKRFEVAIDAALHRRLCTTADLQAVHFALARRGRRGTVAVREALEQRGEAFVPPASELERLARQVFRAAGLREPRYEVDLGGGRWIGRVDCVWTEARLVVELDGRRFHGGLVARDADRRRDNELMARGWRVLRFTWDDLHERPAWVIEQIRLALAHR